MASQIGVLNSHVIKVKANKRIETKNDTQKCNELQTTKYPNNVYKNGVQKIKYLNNWC